MYLKPHSPSSHILFSWRHTFSLFFFSLYYRYLRSLILIFFFSILSGLFQLSIFFTCMVFFYIVLYWFTVVVIQCMKFGPFVELRWVIFHPTRSFLHFPSLIVSSTLKCVSDIHMALVSYFFTIFPLNPFSFY